jgi:hypothetical protein
MAALRSGVGDDGARLLEQADLRAAFHLSGESRPNHREAPRLMKDVRN